MQAFLSENPLVLLIGACEIGFWVLIGAGLATRYLAPVLARRLSTVLLLLVPVLDVVLVVASLLDVARGSTPGLTHGLAAVYLGFTVAFGHSMIKWADGRFAYRFAGGPPPMKPPKYGAANVAYEWREWGKAALAWAIAMAVMVVTSFVAGAGIPVLRDWAVDPMWTWAMRISVVLVIWFVGWPLWSTIDPPRAKKAVDVGK